MSLAELPGDLIDPASGPLLARLGRGDALADLLRDIRVNRCVQFCFEPRGDWVVDASPPPFRPPGSASFHVVVEGRIWIDLAGDKVSAEAGDVLVFPRCSSHLLGAGGAGPLISPGGDLPPAPWSTIPVVRYDGSGDRARILCAFLEARVLDFPPLLAALPELIIVRSTPQPHDWLQAAVAQLIREIDQPSPGGAVIAARLSEILFIELLRRQMLQSHERSGGWLSALGDPVLRRALRHLHQAHRMDWTQERLAAEAGVSKTVLCQRFRTVLGMSPIQYLRQWRLYLASAALADGDQPIIAIAESAGYGTEAAFTRAFARLYGVPPATWRKRLRSGLAAR